METSTAKLDEIVEVKDKSGEWIFVNAKTGTKIDGLKKIDVVEGNDGNRLVPQNYSGGSIRGYQGAVAYRIIEEGIEKDYLAIPLMRIEIYSF